MRIGARKLKSEYPADMVIMQLIRVKTKIHREWLVYQFTSWSRDSSFIQPGSEPNEEDNPYSEEAA